MRARNTKSPTINTLILQTHYHHNSMRDHYHIIQYEMRSNLFIYKHKEQTVEFFISDEIKRSEEKLTLYANKFIDINNIK